ncbi:MAG: hypothetical protein BGP06_12350 [Rhizobiales bacterium 65-9]|nr:replication initiation protein RepC [Hyphomicrobiales bacterium]OJY32600.1 MAG: hypothetical protein BGP06_12350 [Rhizobiales bacterium 65-9]
MREHIATTPFGRRTLSLGQIAASVAARQAIDEASARAGEPGSNQPAAVHKWRLFRSITEAKEEIGVSDRALGVLNALLSFHPETALSLPAASEGDDTGEAAPANALIVFPSNRELSIRANGIGERSLARHLASLVAAGLILRRDSPNGKRYARKARGGEGGFSEVFGFDLSPLVLRAGEIEERAERLRRERQRLQVLRERISLHRRDATKMIASAIDDGAPGDWDGFAQRLLAFSAPLRRMRAAAALEQLEAELGHLRVEIIRALMAQEAAAGSGDASGTEDQKTAASANGTSQESGNDSHDDSHHHISNTQSQTFEPASKEASRPVPKPEIPLGMVLEACPDIQEWAPSGGIASWTDLVAAARLLRSALGISPSAWTAAIEALGETDAAIAVAAILQRHESSSSAALVTSPDGGPPQLAVHGAPAIRSAGGYLRTLTEQAKRNSLSLHALIIPLRKAQRKAGAERHARL